MRRIMIVRVLFFGIAGDAAAMAEDQFEASPGATIADLFEAYARRFPRLREMSSSLVLAANARFSPRTQVLNDGDEVAFLPPVSGGASPWLHAVEDEAGHFFALTRDPIDTRALAARVRQDHDGAVATFEGVVRNHTRGRPTLYLDYECYQPMAIGVMAGLGREIAAAHAISRIAMVHRLGRMEVGAASVVIAVSAPHRQPAFEACLEGINRLKKLVPIWKKEHFAGGDVWVEGEWDSSVLPR
jgi:molybdopterin synthase catalytic subunit